MDPIAIVGIGCRFPQAQNPEAFWQLLSSGRDAIAPVPSNRWQVKAYYDPDPETPGKMNARRGGFLAAVDGFDADFFGMSAEEVEHTDPQQRLFLEVAWEALENAGISPASLAKTQTGVFTGLCTVDYHRLLYKDRECIGPHSGTGTTLCVTSNRLSYLLDLQGPSIAIDAACSSSLVTVHLACQSLRSQETDLCIAGGVNLILSPDSMISSSQTGLLSAEGCCKSFDAGADGYGRGEGCGVLILKRMYDAVRDGDRILASIRGSAVNHNGLSNSLSAPNGLAQQQVIRQALKNARVQPGEISYVDAHAVGTGIGDAIEFKALQTVLKEGRQPGVSCGIGSVKTNIGHLEAAAGISALIKVILALQHEEIPPHLHLQEINPYISLDDSFYIPTKSQSWSRSETSRFAGVSAFGFGGTNAHVVIEEAPVTTRQKRVVNDRPRHLLTLSAKNQLALGQLAQKYRHFLNSHPQIDLADLCFTANTGRNHFKHRLCLRIASCQELNEQLQAFAERRPAEGLSKAIVTGRKTPKVAWLFSGASSGCDLKQHQLYKTQPTFRQAIECCEVVLQLYFSKPLSKLLSEPPTDLSAIDATILNRCAGFAIEYGLAKMWQSWGIKPKVVMGMGVGEFVAATIAGVFDLKTALELVIQGTNSSDNRNQTPAAENFREALQEVNYHPPQIPLISSFTGESAQEAITTPDYWYRHWQPQEAGNCVEALENYPIVLSMGAGTALLSESPIHIFSLSDSRDHWQEILRSLGELYIRGVPIDWMGFDRVYRRNRLALPTYPFQRQRYWFTSVNFEMSEATEPVPQFL